jgi:hypothetical protein
MTNEGTAMPLLPLRTLMTLTEARTRLAIVRDQRARNNAKAEVATTLGTSRLTSSLDGPENVGDLVANPKDRKAA